MRAKNAFVNFTSCDSRTIVTRKLCQLYPAPLLIVITDTIFKKYTQYEDTPLSKIIALSFRKILKKLIEIDSIEKKEFSRNILNICHSNETKSNLPRKFRRKEKKKREKKTH